MRMKANAFHAKRAEARAVARKRAAILVDPGRQELADQQDRGLRRNLNYRRPNTGIPSRRRRPNRERESMSETPTQTMARARVVRRIDALFRAMQTDALLREQFITGPSEILAEYLKGGRITAEKSAVTNRLIYSVFANKKLLKWFQDYAHDHIDDVPSPARFLADFCAAVVDHEGRTVVSALMAACVAGTGVHGLSGDLLHYLINLHAAQVLSGDDMLDQGRRSTRQSTTASRYRRRTRRAAP